MHAVEVTKEFINSIRDRLSTQAAEISSPVEAFHPPRPWHQDKYNTFLKRLVAQNPRS